MNMEFDLMESLKDKEKAKKVVKQVQDAIDVLVLANKKAIKIAEDANRTSSEYEKHTKNLTKACADLTAALKSIHSVLGQKKELFADDKDMKILMDELATFVLGSGSIKLGVFGSELKK